jgi:hypothetical protein
MTHGTSSFTTRPLDQLKTAPLVACILSNSPENIKANMATAGVIQGLLPTMLAMVGSNAADTAMLSMVAKRPLLSLCLAIGSPAVTPMQLFQYPNIVNELKDTVRNRDKRITVPAYEPGIRRVIASMVEYIIALAAVANVATVSYQLGIRTVCNYSTEITSQVLIWAFIVCFIHIGFSIAFSLRIGVTPGALRPSKIDPKNSKLKRVWTNYIREYVVREFIPCVYHPVPKVELNTETYLFLSISWFTSICTVFHIIYGTMVLSSSLFISTQDAVLVAVRYFASAICCRALLAYELAGLRQTYASHEQASLPPS